MTNWFDDIDEKSIDTASEFPTQISLPTIDGDAVVIKFQGEPELVKGKERDMYVALAERIEPNPAIKNGSIILSKSTRFNMAKVIKREGKDYKKFKLTNTTWRLWAIRKDDQKMYQCEML